MALTEQQKQQAIADLTSGASISDSTFEVSPERVKALRESVPTSTGFFGVREALSGIGTGIKDAIGRRTEAVSKIQGAESGGFTKARQTLGQGAGLLSDVIEETVLGGVKAVTPQAIEKPVGQTISSTAQAFMNTKPVQEFMKSYEQLPQEVKNEIGSQLGFGSLALDVAGLSVADRGARIAGRAGMEAAQTAVKTPTAQIKRLFSGTRVKIGDEVLPIPETVKTTLKRTPQEQLDTYINQAKLATTDQKSITPLELAGTKATEALESVQRRLNSIGSQKSNILERAKIGNKPMGDIALKARRDLEKAFQSTILDQADQNLINRISEQLVLLGRNPQLKQVDEFIDFAQDQLWKASDNLTVKTSDKVTGYLRKLVGKLNSQVKQSAGKSYKNLNARYADTVQLRNQLNKALGPQGDRGGSLMKRVFSPTDSGTKKMFEEVKRLTGIDLTDEAVLAKFAMELFGDTRQRNLLQQLSIPSTRGVIEKIIDVSGGVLGVDDFFRNLKIKKAKGLAK